MVNNPVRMRCEFIGEFCMKGNYTHGCLKALDDGKLSSVNNLDLVDIIGLDDPRI
jgi:hypothetical protein